MILIKILFLMLRLNSCMSGHVNLRKKVNESYNESCTSVNTKKKLDKKSLCVFTIMCVWNYFPLPKIWMCIMQYGSWNKIQIHVDKNMSIGRGILSVKLFSFVSKYMHWQISETKISTSFYWLTLQSVADTLMRLPHCLLMLFTQRQHSWVKLILALSAHLS